MNDLVEAFHHCGAELDAVPATVDCGTPPLARQLLADLPSDPGFWIQYANICRAMDDFPEAELALEQATLLLDAERNNPFLSSGRLAVVDYLAWRSGKVKAELLKVQARSNPFFQASLIQHLRSLAEISHENIWRRLEGSLTEPQVPSSVGPHPDDIWLRHLDRIRYSTNRHGQFDTDYHPDLAVIQDLATALMGSGRFEEAARLFTEPPFSQFVAKDREAKDELEWYPRLIHWLRTFLKDPFEQVSSFKASGPRYTIGMVVWGEAFLDSLEQFSLASLLAQGNLPYLQNAGEVHALFFTTEEGAQRLHRMPAFQAIQQLVTCDIVTFPTELTRSKDTYKLMSSMHLAAMEVAKLSQSHFLFLAPDIVLADNFLQAIDQRMQQGAEVVFVPGLMLLMESFADEQRQRYPTNSGALSISPRDLLELGIRHVHPTVKQAYIYSPRMRRGSCSVVMWPLADEGGFVVHGFHHTPYLVSAKAMARFDDSLFFTIDGEFLLKIIRSQDELDHCVLLTDLQETNYFELSSSTRFDFPVEFDFDRVCRWGSNQGFVAQWLFPQRVCFGSSGQDQDQSAHGQAAEAVSAILRQLAPRKPELTQSQAATK